MENNGTNTNMGDLVISEEVIATIVTNATMDVKGVAAMAPKAAADIRGLFHKKESASKSVAVQRNDSANTTVIDVYIKIESGAKITEVAGNIQQSVKEAVQNMTGCVVSRVNVHIADIDLTEATEEQ